MTDDESLNNVSAPRRRRTVRLLVTSSIICATVVAGSAIVPAAAAGANAGVAYSAGTMPPEPGSTLGRRIASLALQEVGAREHTGQDDYPQKYQEANRHIQYGVDWCGIFVYWTWTKAGVTDLPRMTPPASGEDKEKKQGHWATYWKKWAKKHDQWRPIRERNPEIGDAVVYGDFPGSGHIGIVVDVKYSRHGKATHVRTVEGNVSNQVSDLGWRKLSELTGGGQQATGFVSPT